VLNGPQGIGKSTLIAHLGMEWFSDSLSLSDMNDKTAAEKLQGYWIMEIGELAGMKKADIDKVKAFISRQDDKYRASFGRRVTPHLRQCVFFGTTNSDNGYLRDVTGNRRFWNVKVTGEGKWKPWDLDTATVQQIWAETLVYAKAGERLFLSPELEEYAREEQREALEMDDREGIVREYLDMLLPADWDTMDIYRRREYFREPSDPTRPIGVKRRDWVCNLEIWCECFGKNKEDFDSRSAYPIASIMARIEGWEKDKTQRIIRPYGKQRVYKRTR
jgi:predicted P-loop ATPase